MRQSFIPEWLLDHNNVYGIWFGADYCAEHEWGIDRIREEFPDNTKEDPSITGVKLKEFDPDCWRFFSNTNKGVLLFDAKYHHLNKEFDYRRFSSHTKELILKEKKDLVTAWDGYSFGIHVAGKDNIKKLTQLWEAIQICDIACWLGGSRSNPFENSGLVLSIISKTPAEYKLILREGFERINKEAVT